jgi:hypothetical protein
MKKKESPRPERRRVIDGNAPPAPGLLFVPR